MDTTISSRPGLGREFARLWAAVAASNLGDGVWLVAAPLMAAALTRDPTLVAGLTFAQRIPWLFFPLISGALADRIDRRKAMVAVTVSRASLVGLLGLAVWTDTVSIPMLYAVFFLVSAGETLFDTTTAALLPAIVHRDDLTAANARLAGTISVTNQFVGLPLGGFLFSKAAFLPFASGAGALAMAAATLASLKGSFEPAHAGKTPAGSMRSEIKEGIVWLWRSSVLRTATLMLGMLNLTLMAQLGIMVLFVEDQLGMSSTGYVVLLTLSGIGGLLGSLIAGRVIRLIGDGVYLRLAVVIEAVIPAVLAVTESPYLAGAMLLLFGLNSTTWGVVLATVRQRLTPDHLRGRVQSVFGLIGSGTAAPGALLGGVMASRFGLTAPFWFSAVVGVMLLPVVWRVFSNVNVANAVRVAASADS